MILQKFQNKDNADGMMEWFLSYVCENMFLVLVTVHHFLSISSQRCLSVFVNLNLNYTQKDDKKKTTKAWI